MTILILLTDKSINYYCNSSVLENVFVSFNSRVRLFKGWITLSTGKIAFLWKNVNKTKYTIHWMVIYLLDRVIRSFNNWDLIDTISTLCMVEGCIIYLHPVKGVKPAY